MPEIHAAVFHRLFTGEIGGLGQLQGTRGNGLPEAVQGSGLQGQQNPHCNPYPDPLAVALQAGDLAVQPLVQILELQGQGIEGHARKG